MNPAWGSDIAAGAAEGKEDVAAQDSNHVEGSKTGEAHSHQGKLDKPEVRKSDVRD